MVKKYVKKKPKYKKKRGVMAKRKGMRRQNVLISRPQSFMNGFPMPPRMMAKFSIDMTGTIATAAFNGGTNALGTTGDCILTVQGNSPYNPFNTPISGSISDNRYIVPQASFAFNAWSCTGFSNLCSPIGYYENYRVHASKITVQTATQSTSDNIQISVVPQTDGSQHYNSASNAASYPYTRTKILTLNSPNAAGVPGEIKYFMSTAKVTGVPKVIVSTPQYGTMYGTYPTAAWFWAIYISTIDNAASGLAIPIRIRLTYYTELYNVNEAAIPHV